MTKHNKIPAVGSRAQVWHGNARHTSGGLYKKDLKKNDAGRIVSKKASAHSKKLYKKNCDKMAAPFKKGGERGMKKKCPK